MESQEKDERKAVEHSWLQNGHAMQMKTDSKNRSNTKNNRKYEEKVHKPVKIVQEDIRPSIPNNKKEEKGVKIGKDSRLIVLCSVCCICATCRSDVFSLFTPSDSGSTLFFIQSSTWLFANSFICSFTCSILYHF